MIRISTGTRKSRNRKPSIIRMREAASKICLRKTIFPQYKELRLFFNTQNFFPQEYPGTLTINFTRLDVFEKYVMVENIIVQNYFLQNYYFNKKTKKIVLYLNSHPPPDFFP